MSVRAPALKIGFASMALGFLAESGTPLTHCVVAACIFGAITWPVVLTFTWWQQRRRRQ